MSLLQEALKRQEEEAAREKSSATDAKPTGNTGLRTKQMAAAAAGEGPCAAPPPLPEQPHHSKEWLAGLLVIGGVVLLLAILGTLYGLLLRSRPGETVTDPIGPDPVGSPLEPREVEVAEDVQVPDEPVAEEYPPVAPAEDERDPEVVPPEPDAPSVVADRSRPQETPPVRAEPVRWPDIRIQAAMGTGTTGSVMIEGQIIRVGERYQGVRIVEITGRGVRLEYGGEERLAPVRR